MSSQSVPPPQLHLRSPEVSISTSLSSHHMAVHDDSTTKVAGKKRSWTAYIPRPGSSSGRPGSSSGRPGSSSGFKLPSGSSSNDSGSSNAGPSPHAAPRPSSFVGSFGRRPGSSNGFKIKEIIVPLLATPQEGKELDISQPPTLVAVPTPHSPQPFRTHGQSQVQSAPLLPLPRLAQRPATAHDGVPSPPPSRPASRPTTPKRWSSSLMLTSSFATKTPAQELDHEAGQPAPTATERINSKQPSPEHAPKPQENKMSSGKSYLSSMMGGLSMSLSRTNTRESTTGNGVTDEPDRDKEKDRGRSLFKSSKRAKSASQAPPELETPAASRSRSRARSQSPFFFRRNRQRDNDTSPTPQPLPLAQSETDLSDINSSVHPRNAFTDDQDSGDETVGETDYSDEDGEDRDDYLDTVTGRNTEQNAVISLVVPPDAAGGIDGEEPDPLGEGVNVVVPPEPYFPTTLNALGGSNPRNRRNPRRRKSVKHHDPLPFNTSRPAFQRDRCTIAVTQGDPAAKLGGRRKRKYVVASDLSEESRYAVEWGIGTVLRDGDEMLLVTVVENESKVDPEIPNTVDRTLKLRSQQERQGLAYILAWHAKNARHMLLDIVDYTGPTMVIVGSRGLGKLNGILLGSTSHYLIQKCSVPVMVARRRLKRPPKKSAHLSTHRQHVKLSEAGIDRVAAKVDQDVKVMWDEIQKEDNRRDGGPGSRDDRRGLVVGASDGPEVLLEQEDEDEEADASAENGEEEEPKDTEVIG